jgi:hypothetical protein
METEKDLAVKKRLNKIAVLIDRHSERVAIQAFYIKTLMANPSEETDYKPALAEAMRLELYHSKELRRLEEEQRNLLPA